MLKNVFKRSYVLLLLVAVLMLASLSGCSKKAEEVSEVGAGDTITIKFGLAKDAGAEDLIKSFAKGFKKYYPNVEVVPLWGSQSTTEQLALYLQAFESKSSDIDVIQCDVIWPGDIAQHLVTLDPYITDELLANYNPAAVQNNRVKGELKALPQFVDFGVLYYRHDLLEKYGYNSPPTTWEELEEMSKKVQAGERAEGNGAFWGYVWQGSSYEGLTCDAIEWVSSVGGGSIVEADGTISINNPEAIEILNKAKSWIGTISPKGILNFKEEDSRKTFQAGNALFMRNWPYASALGSADDSIIKGLFDIAPLPGKDGKSAAALGGWQVCISKYSENEAIAVEFAKYITGPEGSKMRALANHQIPAYLPTFQDPEVMAAVPEFARFEVASRSVVARPSTPTSPHYAEVSRIFYTAVHDILSGKQDAETAVEEIEIRIGEVIK